MSDHFENEFELSNEEMHLYSRQILLDGWDIEAQEKLKLANVLIIGAGGIGCTSAELLARAGVGKITIVDADTIEMSNLQRQIAFTSNDLGRYKAEILAKHLQAINPHIQVRYQNIRFDETNADDFVQHQDVVLDGCDNFTTRYLVNRVCKTHQVPLISASAIANSFSNASYSATNFEFVNHSLAASSTGTSFRLVKLPLLTSALPHLASRLHSYRRTISLRQRFQKRHQRSALAVASADALPSSSTATTA